LSERIAAPAGCDEPAAREPAARTNSSSTPVARVAFTWKSRGHRMARGLRLIPQKLRVDA
jgi:hypothetical protein